MIICFFAAKCTGLCETYPSTRLRKLSRRHTQKFSRRDTVMEMQSEDAMVSEEESYGPILVNRLEVNEREGAILSRAGGGGNKTRLFVPSRAAASRRTT